MPKVAPCSKAKLKSVLHVNVEPVHGALHRKVKYASDWSVFHLCTPERLVEVPEDRCLLLLRMSSQGQFSVEFCLACVHV